MEKYIFDKKKLPVPVLDGHDDWVDIYYRACEMAFSNVDYIKKEVESGKYPQYKAFGMAYIRFAEEENELFKLLFMCDRRGMESKPSSDFEQSVEMIMKANGMTKEKAELIHLEMWTCVHGIATMLATSYISFDRELISRMLTDVYQGLRTRHSQEAENERN